MDGLAAVEGFLTPLFALDWVRQDDQTISVDVEDPVFRNSSLRIKRNFDPRIVPDARIGDFDKKEHISRIRDERAEQFLKRFTYSYVGLWLGKVIDAHRILHTHNRRFSEPGNKKASETIHTAHMAAAGTRHLDNFSANQFEALVRWKDAGIQDALKLVPREELLGDRLRGHTQMILSLPGHVILRVRVNCI